MAAIFPYYYPYDLNYTIAPEIWSNNRVKPDFSIWKTNINKNGLIPYGHSTPVVLAECKIRVGVSWWVLINTQLWNKADSLKNNDGKLWVIAQIGFEVCFHFDIPNYLDSETYINFSPLNLNNLSQKDLSEMWVQYITERISSTDVIQVIKWRLDDPDFHSYIHDMFLHVSRNNP